MTTVTVEVTADDIANGEAGHCGNYPIALALHRLLHVPVQVGSETLAWHNLSGEFAGCVDLPWAAAEFILRFDRSDPAEPFEFEIDLPDELLAAVTS